MLRFNPEPFHILIFPFQEAVVSPLQPIICREGKNYSRNQHIIACYRFTKNNKQKHCYVAYEQQTKKTYHNCTCRNKVNIGRFIVGMVKELFVIYHILEYNKKERANGIEVDRYQM